MFGTLGRRAVELVVSLFAVLGFCFVPLGSKTGLEHSLSLLRTDSARDAAAGFLAALARVRTLWASGLSREPAESDALPLASGQGRERPVPPPLAATTLLHTEGLATSAPLCLAPAPVPAEHGSNRKLQR